MSRGGRPHTYNRRKHFKKLLEGVSLSCSINQGAHYAGVPGSTFSDWLTRGDHEWKEGLKTPLAQLSEAIRHIQALKAIEFIQDARAKKNPSFEQWILSCCFPRDYGKNSADYEEIMDFLKNIRQDIDSRKTNLGRGLDKEVSYGKTDSSST